MNNQIIKFHLQHETLPVHDYTDYTKQTVSQSKISYKTSFSGPLPVKFQLRNSVGPLPVLSTDFSCNPRSDFSTPILIAIQSSYSIEIQCIQIAWISSPLGPIIMRHPITYSYRDRTSDDPPSSSKECQNLQSSKSRLNLSVTLFIVNLYYNPTQNQCHA